MKIRYKACKHCKVKFEVNPIFPLKYVCSSACAISYSKLLKANKEKKDWRVKKSEMKLKLLTHKDYLKLLQTVFNTFIRLRDKSLPCISCGCYMANRKGDASHYYSVGSSPNLRFNERNVHLSCVPCNQFLHGNLLEYGIRLPMRIGFNEFKELEQLRNVPSKLLISEIKELIKKYKEKTKSLK